MERVEGLCFCLISVAWLSCGVVLLFLLRPTSPERARAPLQSNSATDCTDPFPHKWNGRKQARCLFRCYSTSIHSGKNKIKLSGHAHKHTKPKHNQPQNPAPNPKKHKQPPPSLFLLPTHFVNIANLLSAIMTYRGSVLSAPPSAARTSVKGPSWCSTSVLRTFSIRMR